MAGLLTEIDRSVWKESTFLHFKEPKEGDVKENYRFSILSLVCPPEPFFKCQPAQAISTWFILRINLKAPSGCCQFSSWFPPVLANLTFSIHCSASARTWGGIPGPPRLLIPPHSHIWSFNVQLGPVLRVSSASPFSFNPHPPFNLPSFCFFPPPPPSPSFSLSCPGSGADCSSIRRSRTWPFSERRLITDTAQQWTALKLNYFVLINSEMVCALTNVWQ